MKSAPQTKPAIPHNQRLIQLDVLRAVAILLVLFRHTPFVRMDDSGLGMDSGIFQPLADALFHIGWSGVDLFFVLSGFLVGGLLFKEWHLRGRLDVKRFFIRRGFKIWPSYLLFITVFFIEAIFRGEGHSLRHAVTAWLPNFLHLQNYLGTPRMHTWSLAVEEHFYIVMPLFLLLVTRGRPFGKIRAVPVAAIALLVACGVGRWLALRHATGVVGLMNAAVYPSHLRIDSLFLGVMLAYFAHCEPEILHALARHRRWLWAAGAALVAPMLFIDIRTSGFVASAGLTMVALGYACMLVAALFAEPGVGLVGRFLKSMPGRALALVGYFSYPIYLWHIDLAWRPMSRVAALPALAALPPELRWCAVMATYVGLAVGGGIFASRLIEQPMLMLRDRLFPARTDALAEEQEPHSPDAVTPVPGKSADCGDSPLPDQFRADA